jgi:4-diphosphocytidyl-2-C-methyl-D-erythritol kinase
VQLQAFAKLTLSLRVVSRRDDNYHEIDSEMISIDLYDELQISEGQGLEVVGPYSDGVPSDETNLVSKALVVCGKEVRVKLTKNIPSGAGLGGGSADAAAILRWSGDRKYDHAIRLGSDVPFCLHGGRVRVRGIGEHLQALPYIPKPFTLFIPPLHVETKRVYQEWDSLGGPVGEHHNDLEPAALSAYPEMKLWKDLVSDVTGKEPQLAGSGSTWFLDGEHNAQIEGMLTKVVHSQAEY